MPGALKHPWVHGLIRKMNFKVKYFGKRFQKTLSSNLKKTKNRELIGLITTKTRVAWLSVGPKNCWNESLSDLYFNLTDAQILIYKKAFFKMALN